MTKLAHARYVAEAFPIRIVGFRQRTYHADYVEPRISSREELLQRSYESALKQFQKAGMGVDSHFFVLEDTSVRIRALSTGKKEVPGLDIKYWMQGMTFETLDRLLKRSGNDRTASVRSDVLLHLPKNFRHKWKTKLNYLVFEGEQHGKIVDREYKFESNLVFPWLDAKTFNKWFKPGQATAPLGSLSIEEANQYDFRRKSFTQAIEFLSEYGFIEDSPIQAMLPLESSTNYLLCGYTCAGKTAASQHLTRQYGYEHIEASDFMYLNYYYRHGFHPDVPIGDFAEQALVQKPEIVSEKVAQYIQENLFARIVVSGFRCMDEVDWLQKSMALSGKRFKLVFISASENDRYQRMKTRRRLGDEMDFGRFKDRDLQQRRMGLEGIRKSDMVTIWDNESTLKDYYEFIDSDVNLPNIGRFFGFEEAKDQLVELDAVKLEDSILIGLLSVWSDDEARDYHTTNQIASLINSVFRKISPKHKDNVSRYFNQEFYAYYEVDGDRDLRYRKYRLSNTGFGRALFALNELIKRGHENDLFLSRAGDASYHKSPPAFQLSLHEQLKIEFGGA